jgi:hypothetical protein
MNTFHKRRLKIATDGNLTLAPSEHYPIDIVFDEVNCITQILCISVDDSEIVKVDESSFSGNVVTLLLTAQNLGRTKIRVLVENENGLSAGAVQHIQVADG